MLQCTVVITLVRKKFSLLLPPASRKHFTIFCFCGTNPPFNHGKQSIQLPLPTHYLSRTSPVTFIAIPPPDAQPRTPNPAVSPPSSYLSVSAPASPSHVVGGLLREWLCGRARGCSHLYRDPDLLRTDFSIQHIFWVGEREARLVFDGRGREGTLEERETYDLA